VVEAYRSALTLKGDAVRGVQVFTKTCASCHQFGGLGHAVGPDLASVGDKSPEGLLIAILDPNRAVETRYVNYVALTKNGLTLTGVLAGETGTSITLLGQEGKQQVILRNDLEELLGSDKSAMPEGVEKDLQPQDVADLLAYVRSVSPPPPPKVFAGNKPELVRPAPDGSLHLRASNGEIYGTTLVLEEKHGNLGHWSTNDDHVVWSVDVPQAGKYTVWLDWACDDRMAGRRFVLEAGANRLTGKVAGTGTWDNYRQARVGEIVLEAGPQRVAFRAAGNIAGSLIDLKAIKLVPLGQAEIPK
jgi:putative heme-binding domain-containing protein